MRYVAKGKHNRQFELFDENNNSLGSIGYSGWLARRIEIMLGGHMYHVAPSNFWHTAFHVIKDELVVAALKFNLSGKTIVQFPEGHTYGFKAAFWYNRYTLFTREEKGIITLKPQFKWSEFSYNYEIETDDNYVEGQNKLLLLILVYCCNHIRSRAAASV